MFPPARTILRLFKNKRKASKELFSTNFAGYCNPMLASHSDNFGALFAISVDVALLSF